MKMKQKLAATLAGVMAVSMVPATSVFAASDNRVTNQIITPVKKEADTTLIMKLKDTLEENDTFVLTSTNAYVKGIKDYDSTPNNKNTASDKINYVVDGIDYTQSSQVIGADIPDTAKFVYLYDGANKNKVQIKYVGTSVLGKDTELRVPFTVYNKDKAGDATVVIDAYGTSLTSEEIKLGTIIAKGLSVKLTKESHFEENKDYVALQDIVITETTAGMFEANKNNGASGVAGYMTFKITNSDARFVDFDEETYDEKYTGKYSSTGNGQGGTTAAIGEKVAVGNVHFEDSLGAQGLLATTSAPAYVSDDGMRLYIPIPSLTAQTTSVGKVTIDMSEIKLYKNRDEEDYIGKVEATLVKYWNENGKDNYKTAVDPVLDGSLVLVNDIEQSVTFSTTESAKTVTLGRGDQTVAKIKVKEAAVGSIDKELLFSFPEGVKVTYAKVSKKAIDGDWKEITINGASFGTTQEIKAATIAGKEDSMSRIYRPEVVIAVDETRDRLVDFEITFKLEVSADYEGDDIEVLCESTVSETFEKVETPLVVANTRKAVTIKADSMQLDENYKSQETGKVVIEEAFAGALTAGKKVKLELEEGVEFIDGKGELKVTDGNIEVGKLKYVEDKRGLQTVEFTVNAASKTASTIEISGLQVSTRNVSGGYYTLRVYGDAIADNDINLTDVVRDKDDDKYLSQRKIDSLAKGDTDEFNAGGLLVEDYIAINRELLNSDEKANDSTNKVETVVVTLKDGSTEYVKSDGSVGKMVAPTYRPVDGITMVSVRAIPEMLGATVDYSPESKTVTITMPDGKYAQVTLNSTTATDINGRTVIMNYKAEIPEGKDGGIYVPLRYFGRLLGLADENITYDTATKSVVIKYDKVIK